MQARYEKKIEKGHIPANKLWNPLNASSNLFLKNRSHISIAVCKKMNIKLIKSVAI